MLFHIIYISKSVELMQEQDLLVLLNQSREWNKSHGITGMLLYVQGKFLEQTEGRFIQVLEGTEFDVKEIFGKIRTDIRHQNVTKLNEAQIKGRSFKSWTMGFEQMNLSKFNSLEGAFDLNKTFLERQPSGKFNLALTFLQSFYSMSFNK